MGLSKSICEVSDYSNGRRGFPGEFVTQWETRKEREISAGVLAFTHRGAYLTLLYLLVKVLYLVQVCFQFVILNKSVPLLSPF